MCNTLCTIYKQYVRSIFYLFWNIKDSHYTVSLPSRCFSVQSLQWVFLNGHIAWNVTQKRSHVSIVLFNCLKWLFASFVFLKISLQLYVYVNTIVEHYSWSDDALIWCISMRWKTHAHTIWLIVWKKNLKKWNQKKKQHLRTTTSDLFDKQLYHQKYYNITKRFVSILFQIEIFSSNTLPISLTHWIVLT